MYTIDDIKREFLRLDNISGEDISKLPVRISRRLKTTLGKCYVENNNGKCVPTKFVFSDRFMRKATEEHFLEVVRHEYAHAYVTQITGEFRHHDKLWKHYAMQFGGAAKTKVCYPELFSTQV